MDTPCEKSITSSSVPWITKVGHFTRGTFSIDGNASQHQVVVVPGKATRIPDMSGECRIRAATSSRLARSTLGTVPIDCPYRMIFSFGTPEIMNSMSELLVTGN